MNIILCPSGGDTAYEGAGESRPVVVRAAIKAVIFFIVIPPCEIVVVVSGVCSDAIGDVVVITVFIVEVLPLVIAATAVVLTVVEIDVFTKDIVASVVVFDVWGSVVVLTASAEVSSLVSVMIPLLSGAGFLGGLRAFAHMPTPIIAAAPKLRAAERRIIV